jgi:hypothetical protein
MRALMSAAIRFRQAEEGGELLMNEFEWTRVVASGGQTTLRLLRTSAGGER